MLEQGDGIHHDASRDVIECIRVTNEGIIVTCDANLILRSDFEGGHIDMGLDIKSAACEDPLSMAELIKGVLETRGITGVGDTRIAEVGSIGIECVQGHAGDRGVWGVGLVKSTQEITCMSLACMAQSCFLCTVMCCRGMRVVAAGMTVVTTAGAPGARGVKAG